MGPLNFALSLQNISHWKQYLIVTNYLQRLFFPQTLNANTNLFSTRVNSRTTWTQGWAGSPCWSETILANTKPENLRSAVWFLQWTYVSSILQVCNSSIAGDIPMVEAPACKPVQLEFETHLLPTNKNKTDRHVCNPSNPRIDGNQGQETQAIGSV